MAGAKRGGPVRLTRIWTRGGDGGETSLADGSRARKDDDRVEAVGAVEEANAAVGFARAALGGAAAAEGDGDDALLAEVQNGLFDLGADLSRPFEGGAAEAGRLRVPEGRALEIEREIDRRNASLGPLESFVLPGGSEAAARLHVARVRLRAAERRAVRLAAASPVNPEALRVLNRLSDLLFVLARARNRGGADDVLWRPGAPTAASAGASGASGAPGAAAADGEAGR